MAMATKSLNGGDVVRPGWVISVILLTSLGSSAQSLLPASSPGGMVRIFGSDAAILEARETRKDLPCTVTPNKPLLGFDLKFHSGYDVSIPLKDLAGSDNQLT